MIKSRNIFKPYENTTILDPILFKKKFNFFYDTSFDILFKGEFKRKSNALQVFAESHKESNTASSLNKQLVKPEHKLNKSKTNRFLIKKPKQSRLASSRNDKKSLTHIATLAQQPKHNTFTKYSIRNSQSQKVIEPNNVLKYSNTIRDLDKIINQLDNAIKKEKGKEYFSVLQGSNNDEREKIISLFADYLDADMLQKIKHSYNNLFGKDTYSKRMKLLTKKTKMASLKHIKNKTHREESPQYINMLSDITSSNSQIVNSKYSSLGKVRVLNLPKEFFEEEIEIDKLANKNNIVSDNLKAIYHVENKKIQRQLDYCNKLSKGDRKSLNLKTKELTKINNQSDDLAKNTNLIRKDIINIKTSLHGKSPLLNKKVFAYIEENESKKIQRQKQINL